MHQHSRSQVLDYLDSEAGRTLWCMIRFAMSLVGKRASIQVKAPSRDRAIYTVPCRSKSSKVRQRTDPLRAWSARRGWVRCSPWCRRPVGVCFPSDAGGVPHGLGLLLKGVSHHQSLLLICLLVCSIDLCLSVCLSICLPVCLSACLPACLPACLSN